MTSINDKTADNSVNAVSNMNYNTECKSVYKSSDGKMVAGFASNFFKSEKNTRLPIGNTKLGLLIHSESVCSILNEPLAT